MREIKFRGKRVDNGEWVYGSLIGSDVIVGDIIEFTEEYFNCEYWWRVKPETVGQYTGLRDKNGREIYEGDIIVSTYKDMGTDTGLVVFKDCGFKVEIPNIGDDELVDWESYSDSIEVIGNIYENPELLEVTE